METPSSIRRVTRSQTSLASQNKKQEPELVEKSLPSRSRNRTKPERSVLLDITNDSPIVGLATGILKTPVVQKGSCVKQTPASGEALLRGQVKNLLRKVDEGAVFVKLSPKNQNPFQGLSGLLNSPMGISAPTPANTPVINGLCGNRNEFVPVMPYLKEKVRVTELPQAAEISKQEDQEEEEEEAAIDVQECQRALLFNSPVSSEKSSEAGGSSCSTMIDACSQRDKEEWKEVEVIEVLVKEDEEEENEWAKSEEEGGEGEEVDELVGLCEGLSKMTMNEKRGLPEFTGKHTRFIYNSDEEIEGEEEVVEQDIAVSPNVLCLKGLPIPEGKHLRFQVEDED